MRRIGREVRELEKKRIEKEMEKRIAMRRVESEEKREKIEIWRNGEMQIDATEIRTNENAVIEKWRNVPKRETHTAPKRNDTMQRISQSIAKLPQKLPPQQRKTHRRLAPTLTPKASETRKLYIVKQRRFSLPLLIVH